MIVSPVTRYEMTTTAPGGKIRLVVCCKSGSPARILRDIKRAMAVTFMGIFSESVRSTCVHNIHSQTPGRINGDSQLVSRQAVFVIGLDEPP